MTGYLASDDPDDIATKISEALANVAFPKMCRTIALEKYSNEACAIKERQLLKELLALGNK